MEKVVEADSAPIKERIYRDLRAEILSLRYKPGEFLVESTVAQACGVSRTPAREALSRLVDEGLLEVYHRKGYVVTRVTLQDVLESYHLRILLEGEAALLAAERDTSRLVAALWQNFEQNRRAPSVALNRDFHLLIARASGHQRLVRWIEQLLDESLRVAILDPFLNNPGEGAHVEHQVIIESLARRETAVRRLVQEHLENGRDRVLKLLPHHARAEL